MTDPRQTGRHTVLSARTKTYTAAPVHIILEPAPPPRRRWVTGHGIGWLVGVLVGVATLWTVLHR